MSHAHTSAAVVCVKLVLLENKLVIRALYVREIEVRLRDEQSSIARFNLVATSVKEGESMRREHTPRNSFLRIPSQMAF